MNLETTFDTLTLSNKTRKTVPKSLKEQLWYRQIGKNIGSSLCYVCRIREITPFTFEAGHIVAVAKGGTTTLDNLRCICLPCNRSMGTEHLEIYKKRYYPEILYPCYVCKKETNGEQEYVCCRVYVHKDCELRFYEEAVRIFGRKRVFLRMSNCPNCFVKK